LIASLLLLPSAGAQEADGPLAAAEELIRQGRRAEARTELERIAEENRGDEIAVTALLRMIDLEQDGATCFKQLEELYSSTDNARVLLAIARYRYAVGAYAAAADNFRVAARGLSGEEKRDALVWEGTARIGTGEIGKGIDLLSGIAESTADGTASTDRARFLAARAYAARDDHRGTLEMVLPLTARENDFSAPALLLAARSMQANGDGAEAKRFFKNVTNDHPESGEASAAREALLAMGANEASPREISDGWFVQIASFENEMNARKFIAARRSEGIGAVEMYRDLSDGVPAFPIRIGPFSNEEEARAAGSHLAGQGVEGNIVHVTKSPSTAGE